MSNLFYSVKVSKLPSVWERAVKIGSSSVILLFVKICLSIVAFDVWYKLWALTRPVPEVSLLILLAVTGSLQR